PTPPAHTARASERARQDLVRALERHALRLRDRRWERPQEWRAAVVDFPPQQHGIVFMGGVVAVLHEHSAPIAELHRERDASVRAEPIHVLAALLPRRDVISTAHTGQDLTFFDMEVDRLIRIASIVDQLSEYAG